MLYQDPFSILLEHLNYLKLSNLQRYDHLYLLIIDYDTIIMVVISYNFPLYTLPQFNFYHFSYKGYAPILLEVFILNILQKALQQSFYHYLIKLDHAASFDLETIYRILQYTLRLFIPKYLIILSHDTILLLG